jgi:hypothetical protein
MNHRTLLRIALLLLAAGIAHAATPQLFTIKATKKTGDTRKNVQQIGNIRRLTNTEKDIFYQLEISTVSPAAPTNFVVTWAVLVENEKGRLHAGCLGGTTTNFARGARTVEVETDSVELDEHTQQRKNQNFSRGSDIYGYGIRITDMTGKLLAEKIEPSKAAAEINEAFEGKHGGRDAR